MAKHKIKWLLFHEPVELFIRTAEDFQRHLDQLTNSKYEIEILTLGQYQDKYLDGIICDPFTELKEGRVQISQIYANIIGSFNAPDFYALSMPYLFDNHEHAARVFEGEIGKKLFDHLHENTNVHGLAYTYSGGYRCTASNTPLNTVEDFAGKTFKRPVNYGRKYGEHFSKQSKQDRQYERFHSWNYSDNYDDVMATYHQQIYAIDVAVGMIRKALKESGTEKNTVIIYTSDNGFFCGSHGYGSKVLPYEESSRVPLVIYDPRHQNSGKKLRSSALTGNIDFAPTILKLAGLPVPENMDGKDLMTVYDNPKSSLHKALPLINVWGKAPTHCLGVVTEKMKYLYWGYAAEGFEVTEELYDLEKDPLELTNLAQNPSDLKSIPKMQRLYDQQLKNWKKQAVSYNDYQRFGELFSRHQPWEKRMKFLSVKKLTKTQEKKKKK